MYRLCFSVISNLLRKKILKLIKLNYNNNNMRIDFNCYVFNFLNNIKFLNTCL